jgi:hypothetical protein
VSGGVSLQSSEAMKSILIFVIFSFISGLALAGSFKFGVTKEFCELHFNGDMAFAGEPYNATDVIESELPFRRVISELVTSDIAYIWYEHGGRGYHQHLVRYNVLKPSELLENYTFYETKYRSIQEIIADKGQLKIGSEKEL